MEARELRRHPVDLGLHVAEAVAGRHRELDRIVQTRVPEPPLAVHLQVGHEGVPVGDRAPAGPGVEVEARQAERGRDQRGARLPVGPERLAVEDQLGVELPRAPALQHVTDLGILEVQQAGERAQVRRQRDDRADVEVAVGPAVPPATDPRGQRVVHGGVTKGALDSHRPERPVRVKHSGDPDDRIQFQ